MEDSQKIDVAIGCKIVSTKSRKLLSPLTSHAEIPPALPFLFKDTAQRNETETVLGQDGLTERVFETGTRYVGEWTNYDMDGMCALVFPNGALFEGNLCAGMFDEDCSIYYPQGGTFQGFWSEGKLKSWKYIFSDGLVCYSSKEWKYLKEPDRRFWSEINNGLRPGGDEQLTNKIPAYHIPEGLYDVGCGFYNPRDLSIRHQVTGEFIRHVPTSVKTLKKVNLYF